MTTQLREQADKVSDHLARTLPGILGVCLYGSVARGDDSEGSDIDLLVVGEDQSLSPSKLRRTLPPGVSRDLVSFAYHTPQSLNTYFDRWPRFMAHVRREGQVLFDRKGMVGRALEREVPLSTELELRAQLRHLENFDHLERFGESFLFCLAQLARQGRAVVFALLAERGILEFRRASAFDRLAVEDPDALDDLAVVRRLQPFYELVTRRSDGPLPFSPSSCPEEVAAGQDAVRRLISRSRYANELASRT